MKRNRILTLAAATLAAGTMGVVGGCQSDAAAGAGIGAGIGAIGGAVIGHNTNDRAAEGAAIGAAAGALGGYILGNESDKRKQYDYHHQRHPNYDY